MVESKELPKSIDFFGSENLCIQLHFCRFIFIPNFYQNLKCDVQINREIYWQHTHPRLQAALIDSIEDHVKADSLSPGKRLKVLG